MSLKMWQFALVLFMLMISSASVSGQSGHYPISQSSSQMLSIGSLKIAPVDLWHMNFICDIMSSCGLYPAGPDDIKTGAGVYPAGQTGAGIYPTGQISNGQMVDLGGVRSGATVSLIDSSRIKIVE
jgi:hypothetical protein